MKNALKKKAFAGGMVLLILLCGQTNLAHGMNLSKVIENADGGITVRLSGEIQMGDSGKVTELLSKLAPRQRISEFQLDSPGGSIFEGEMISQMIRNLGAAVSISTGDTCASACFLLFASGVHRFVSPGAFIGVHSASVNGQENIASLAVTTLIARDARDYGVPSSILGKIVATEPGDIYWLTKADLTLMSVAFRESTVRHPQEADSSRSVSRNVVAEFRGNYACFQGITSLTLQVLPASKRGLQEAIFNFGALDINPSVPAGSFVITGHIDLSGGRIDLHPVRWISKPSNWVMIGLKGSSSDGGSSFSGRIVGGSNCGNFALVRVR